ncbi:hypothetical protein A2627_01775 [Candidatus Woesebacteria bacterium RIFCSPHIGHO2_01_FULL_39_28]|uniref:AMP-dependent synthetase/ligase domain-containing protein n=1 Tax=Candidatus Woesebacteria bacterium RIFCSPHIGHO2_01_FULL_39_28 TaxID=1802496 RepID=A0A1F7YKT8_9BACT|nr:MAG: hypothetical protein A2627_01775 [Candidatus Woesebacteria bacterium RIFCSPHIGHO2_01_FULL_39_28]
MSYQESEKEKLILTLDNNLPLGVDCSNLMGNDLFIEWLIPIVSVLRESDFWEKERMNEIQEKRLQILFSYLENHSIFWGKRLQENGIRASSSSLISALSQLPQMGKDDLRSFKSINQKDISKYITRMTSGTTGIPLSVSLTEKELISNSWPCFFRSSVINEFDLPSLLRKKFILRLGANSQQYKLHSKSFLFGDFARLSDFEVRREIYKEINLLGPMVLWGLPSLILELSKYLKKDGVSFSLRAVYLSGEECGKGESKIIEEFYGVPLVNWYGGVEANGLGVECPLFLGSGFFHMHWERVLIEIVNDSGTLVADGEEGNILITLLDRKTTPLIRYAIGDKGKLMNGKCRCGRTSPLLKISGRQQNFIRFTGGDKFSVVQFRRIFSLALGYDKIKQFQIKQNSLSDLTLYVVADFCFSQLKKDLLQIALSSALQNKINISIEQVDEIERLPNGKFTEFVAFLEVP